MAKKDNIQVGKGIDIEWNIVLGENSCEVQLYIKRQSEYSVSAGDPFKLECPVKYCASRPDVTWCKLKGTECLHLGDRHQQHTSWEERKNIAVFILHFEAMLPSDSGSYRCSANSSSRLIKSHSITISVTEWTLNNSEHLLRTLTDIPDATSTSGPLSEEEIAGRPWLLYSLVPLGGLLLLVMTCFCLFCCLRRHQEKQKKSADTPRREINLTCLHGRTLPRRCNRHPTAHITMRMTEPNKVDVPHSFRTEKTEVGTRQNSQTLPSETEIYDNDPDSWVRMQKGPEVYSNPCLEENKQGIVYASLNHSIIGMNPRQGRNVKEASTEYASICVRS
ncbi:PREDICTED: B- and T-lymphocyte attenuator [Galeopterus variegatus]|uniref:B- and T-lymphocyte attenuator n=1 Tax=Galeopterus variegatus TaxID=482537 RepID=A0ABM0QUG5_GALVR|nr:PREDICTED: B- and T-lymphocyte attenuator [Galeopterus variegatus]